MKTRLTFNIQLVCIIILILIMNPCSILSQENRGQNIALEDYISEFFSQDDNYLADVEEWSAVIDQWLEKPLCINNEEAELLVEYKIISLYQLNKLKEYRYIYGNLLSVYELSFIEGWDFRTVRKVIPLVSPKEGQKARSLKKFNYHSVRQSLVMKAAFHTQKTAGYKTESSGENGPATAFYSGSPARLAIRYDLEYRNKLAFGFRSEKDPGEPLLINSIPKMKNLKTPDLLTGYLMIKKLGPVQSVIIGNYRVSFGYGVNLSGGQSAIKNRSGLSGMAHQVKPQTSVSETGYFRGAAITAGHGKFSFTGFASLIKADGTSVVIDSLTGKPISFSTINKSGLHRTSTELDNRKRITEETAGGILVFRNQWLKTGLIAIYNQFNARIAVNDRAYDRFGLAGKGNLVTGFSATIWLPGVYIFNESSVSKNKGIATVSGIQLQPAPGAQIHMVYHYFGTDYQNWSGSGYISSGQNSGETGLLAGLRLEIPGKWLVELDANHSHTRWVSYDLRAPSERKEIDLVIEKGWQKDRLLHFSFRYLEETIEDPQNSEWICHTAAISQYRLRLEGRVQTGNNVKLKSRFEFNLVHGLSPSWLIFQDIELKADLLKGKFWLRTCFFEAPEYEASIYAYENDVLYDFTSFMHYGKGLRGIFMARFSLLDWFDLWLRFSTIYYTNKKAGSGWDEADGSRQNEIEIQVRINFPG
jgi:hypothetical protein